MAERYPLVGRVLIFALRAQVRVSENFYYKKIYTFPINSKNIDSENFFLQKFTSKHWFYQFSPYLCIGVKVILLKFAFL